MKKLVIFDLDGTLVNTLEDLADSVNKALECFGFDPHCTEAYRYFVGDGTLMLVERALPECSRDMATIDSVHKLFSEIYSKNYLAKSKAYTGISEVICSLKDKGLKIAVATNKPDRYAKEIIAILFGKDCFDYVIGKIDTNPKKPDPTIINNILNHFEIDKNDAVMIGDSNVDIFTGKNAEITTVGCLWGFRDFNELSDAGADYIAKQPFDIIDIVLNA